MPCFYFPFRLRLCPSPFFRHVYPLKLPMSCMDIYVFMGKKKKRVFSTKDLRRVSESVGESIIMLLTPNQS